MNKTLSIKVGSRKSALALRQTQMFVDSLCERHPGLAVEVVKITTSGDRIQDRFLSQVGGKGLFVKEIEEALLKGEIDFAIHSSKDLPAELPSGLILGCFPKRVDPSDVLVSKEGVSLKGLKSGAIIGTSSLRRRSQISKERVDLNFKMLRGNIDTRMKKLSAGEYDAIVLAKAGMVRLGIDLSHAVPLPIVPSPGQGALAIEVREEDERMRGLLQPLHHPITQSEVEVERFIMKALGGDCDLPLGVLARVEGEKIKVCAYIGFPDGAKSISVEREGALENPMKVAEEVLVEMWEGGAEEIIKVCHSS